MKLNPLVAIGALLGVGLVLSKKSAAAAAAPASAFEYITMGDGSMSVTMLVGGALYLQVPTGGKLVSAQSQGSGVIQPIAPGIATAVAAFSAISPGVGAVLYYWNDLNGVQHQGGITVSVGVAAA